MQSCRDALVCDNIRLVYFIFGRLKIEMFAPAEKEDILSSGVLGLVKAANTFDEKRGVKFSTYAAMCIRNEIFMFLRKANRYYTREVSLEEPVTMDDNGATLTIADTLVANENPQDECLAGIAIEEFMHGLPSKDKQILRMRASGYKQKEIASATGYSQAHIARRLKGIKAKWRIWNSNSLAPE